MLPVMPINRMTHTAQLIKMKCEPSRYNTGGDVFIGKIGKRPRVRFDIITNGGEIDI